jgi:hypothetical protein
MVLSFCLKPQMEVAQLFAQEGTDEYSLSQTNQ